MNYTISCPDPQTHMLRIRAEFNVEPHASCLIHLPLWRPGRYEAANYAKNVRSLRFTSSTGEILPSSKSKVSSWLVKANGDGKIIANYEYFAFKMDAGSSWVDDELYYVNFVNCLLYKEKAMYGECRVTTDIPADYIIATSLHQPSHGQFIASDYYELVDSPVLAAKSLQHLNYMAGETRFSIWSWGHELDESIITDFRKFSEEQINMMQEFPEQEYHFQLLFLPYKFYHGVEHGASTVICLGPSGNLNTDEMNDQLLGVSSHELFHAWNIIKIRPREIYPYKFHEPVCFPTGFVAEGFTTYYGDLFLVRSNVRSRTWYLKELERLLKRHFDNFGRLALSVVDSSMDLWIDGYQKSAPARKSSIYVEGAVTALMLDLTIRRLSGDANSLDDAIRILYTQFAQKFKGYTLEDINRVVSDVSKSDMTAFFDKFVTGTEEKSEALKDLLQDVGLILELTYSENILERYFGIRIVENDGKKRISAIYPGSEAEKFFSLDDEIEKINNEPFDSNQFGLKDGENVFLIGRMNGSREIRLLPGVNASYFPVPRLYVSENASAEALKRLDSWIG